MSHLACADEPRHPMNETQRQRFDRLRAKLPPAPASLANSGGILLGRAYAFRPGAAGHRALWRQARARGQTNPMQPVVRLAAASCRCARSAPATTVGYGATYKVQTPLAHRHHRVGYADGFLRALSVATEGRAGPVGYHRRLSRADRRARVSMDFITVDVTDVPQELAGAAPGWR